MYDVYRHSLEWTYFSIIRPKLEYVSHIWQICTKQDTDKLEHFQLHIAKNVTGVRKGASHDLIYKEINWLSLSERCSLNCIKQFVKMSEKHSPEYLKSISRQNLCPGKIGKTRSKSRNTENLEQPNVEQKHHTCMEWIAQRIRNIKYISEK